jgi:lambda repressor-like predicted transcriptional regulator
MKSEAIRRALFRVRKEKSQAQIARDLNVTPTHINRVVKRQSESKRVKLAIAEALNKNPEVVWPETFRKAS